MIATARRLTELRIIVYVWVMAILSAEGRYTVDFLW